MKPESDTGVQRRSAIRLREELERRMVSYALVAGTAGVAFLAAAPTAHADIVYTPKFGRLTSGKLLFDLNLDGTPDFEMAIHSRFAFTSWNARFGYVKVALGGNAGASVIPSNGSAAVLASGSVIGPSQDFKNVNAKRAQLVSFTSFQDSSFFLYSAKGNWKNQEDRFLGLKFKINGETHYGWAKLSVRYPGTGRVFTVTVKGFAYETVPDQSIQAGQTAERQVSDVAPPSRSAVGTLGSLALGASGLDVWRREEVTPQ